LLFATIKKLPSEMHIIYFYIYGLSVDYDHHAIAAVIL